LGKEERPVNADTSYGGLTPEAWDKLAGPNFYSTSAWLRFCTAETGTPGDAVVAYEGGEPACAVPVRELGGLPKWSRYRWNDRLSEFGLPKLAPRGLLVGAPEGFQTHFLAPAGRRSTARFAKLIDELRQAGDSAGGPGERACVAMFLTTDDVLAARHAGVTAEPVLLDADAWLPVPEGGWPGWLEALPSNRAKTVRKEDRRFQEAGYDIAHVPLAECWERLGTAAAATLRKYGHETTPETELISLGRAVECMGEAARVAVLRLGAGDPLGFCIYYLWGDTAFLRWVGFDYERLVGTAEYFNLVFYSQMKRAPALGVRWIHVGATATATKALRGAQLRPLWLLDFTEDSVLAKVPDQVRRHNARLYGQFADDPRTAAALVPRDAWQAFC